MMLRPPAHQHTREAILAFGVYGSGKSEGWASIGEMYRTTDTPGHFHVLSTEWERAHQIAEGCSTDFFSNSTIYEVGDFDELMDASLAIKKVTDASDDPRQDWLIVDSITPVLEWSRNVWFNANQDGGTYRDFANTGRKMTEVPSHGWGQMKTLYGDWIQPHVLRFPGHVYATAQADTVNTEGAWADKGAIKNMFGRIGMKPLGDKHYNPYLLTSVLLATNPTKGEYQLTTVKDRKGRDYLTGEVVAPLPLGFTATYLMGIAGWVTD
jgi:hypothetical protein